MASCPLSEVLPTRYVKEGAGLSPAAMAFDHLFRVFKGDPQVDHPSIPTVLEARRALTWPQARLESIPMPLGFCEPGSGLLGFSYSYEKRFLSAEMVRLLFRRYDFEVFRAPSRLSALPALWASDSSPHKGTDRKESAGEELHLHGFGPPAVGIRLLLSGTGRYSRSASRFKFQRSRPCGLLSTDTQEVRSFKEGWSILRPAGGGFGRFHPQGHGVIASVLASRPLRWSTARRR